MRYLHYILLLCMATSLLACDTEVVIKLPSEANKPVVNVLLNKDSIIYVRLTLSGKLANTNSFTEPKDAVVQLFDNDQFKETLTLRQVGYYYYYCSTTKMQAGHTYRVTAAITGQELAEGTDMVPDSVVTGELKRIEAPINGIDVDNKVILELKDKAGERNYYRIRIFGAHGAWKPDSTFFVQKYGNPAGLRSDDPTLEFLEEGENTEIFIDDKLFDGRSPRFVFALESRSRIQYLVVEVTTLTYDSYRYLKSSYLAVRKAENPIAEKVLVFNNIKNGLGIVGGIAMREYVLPQ